MNLTPETLPMPPRFIASAAVVAVACSFAYGAVAASERELRVSRYEGDVRAGRGGQVTATVPVNELDAATSRKQGVEWLVQRQAKDGPMAAFGPAMR
jgi:hypothetical protein